MPIRFLCNHCGQKLSVGSARAGTKANCPRCKELVRVPGDLVRSKASLAASMLVMSGHEDAASEPPPTETEPEAPPIAGDQGYETSELVFDTSSPATDPFPAPATDAVQQTDYNLVSIPRYVLYAQAGLLAGVAIICFTLGALMGGAFFRAPPEMALRPCTITGYVQVTEGVVKKGDAGAVVIVMPQDVQKVDERAPVSGLRPRDAAPDETHRGLAILKQIGGGYAKADKEGKYQVRVPRQGKYFVLVISRSKEGAATDVDALDLRRIARFFESATELIGTQKYQFSEERFAADRKFDVSFE